MRAEQPERRAGGRLAAAAMVLVTLALADGCAGGSFADPTADTVLTANTADAAAEVPVRSGTVRSLPVELVGSWSGDDPQGVGSWTFEFATDGGYKEYNPRRNIALAGQARVAGARLYLQPQDADSQAVTWQVAGGRLSLDGTVYRRTGPVANDEAALVGSWVGQADTWRTVTFSGDGTWEFDDGAHGAVSGRYSVSGDRLDTGRSTYTWSVDGTQLHLRLPDGRAATYSRLA